MIIITGGIIIGIIAISIVIIGLIFKLDKIVNIGIVLYLLPLIIAMLGRC